MVTDLRWIDVTCNTVLWFCPLVTGPASFTGSFHCPVAEEFCRFETITGVRHPEFHAWQLYIVVAVGIFFPFAVFIYCLFPCRNGCVMQLKRW